MSLTVDLKYDLIILCVNEDIFSLVNDLQNIPVLALKFLASKFFCYKVGVTGSHLIGCAHITNEFTLGHCPTISFTNYPRVFYNFHVFNFSPVVPINYNYLALIKISIIFISSIEFCLEKIFWLLTILIYIYTLFGFLMNYLFFFLLLLILYNRNVSNNILSALIFTYLISGASALGGYGNTFTFTIFDTVGLLLYILLLSFYDYMLVRRYLMNKPLFTNVWIDCGVLGLIYVLAINIGIYSTDAIWYTTQLYGEGEGALWFIISCVVTIFSAAFWNLLQRMVINDVSLGLPVAGLCVLRSITESLSFIAICWNTFFSWGFMLNMDIPYFYVISSICGLFFHLFFSFFSIDLESEAILTFPASLLYGLMYLLSFTSVVFNTNGLLGLLSPYIYTTTRAVLITLLGSLVTIILSPDFYRARQANNSLTGLILHVVMYYILILCYIMTANFLWLPFS